LGRPLDLSQEGYPVAWQRNTDIDIDLTFNFNLQLADPLHYKEVTATAAAARGGAASTSGTRHGGGNDCNAVTLRTSMHQFDHLALYDASTNTEDA
jgi:hypothetical protein